MISLRNFARTREEEEQVTMPSRIFKILSVLTLAFCWLGMGAQMLPNPYGPPISVENAKKAAAAALAEAVKNHWNMAVAVVDPNGTLIYYEKMDNTQIGSANVSIAKARSAALYKRPTKAFQDALASGGAGMRVLGLEGAVPVEGGIPIIADGKIIGAIGVSGANSDQDGQCAQAGASTIK
jgi:glc operon protein GlcG